MFETLLTSLIGGPLTGIIGGGIQMLFTWLGEKAKIERIKVEGENEVRKIEASSKARVAEWEARKGVAEAQAKGAADVAHLEAVGASHVAEASTFVPEKSGLIYALFGLVEFLKKLIRPGMAIYLAVITTLLYFETRDMYSLLDVANQEPIREMYVKLVNMFVYLFGVAMSWYYVTRHSLTPPEER